MNDKSMISDMTALSYCDLGIAYRCNYKCRMCYFWKDSPLNESNVLGLEEWKQVLAQLPGLPKQDGFMVNCAGPGETFLRGDIFELIKYGRRLNLRMQVISNGSLFGKDTCLKIADSGLEFLCLSLDSLDAQDHDYLRGVSGARQKVSAAIENMSRYAPQTKIGINTVITGRNLSGIVDLTEWAEKNENISHINFQAVTQPFSFTEGFDLSWFEKEERRFLWPADKAQVNETMETLARFKKLGYKIADSLQQLNNFREYFLNPLQFIKNGRCNLGKGDVLIIDPAGNVSMCSLIGIIGNVRQEKEISKILRSENAERHKKEISECQRNCHLVVSCYYQEE